MSCRALQSDPRGIGLDDQGVTVSKTHSAFYAFTNLDNQPTGPGRSLVLVGTAVFHGFPEEFHPRLRAVVDTLKFSPIVLILGIS